MPASRTRRAAPAVVRGLAAIAGHQRAITILQAHRAAGRLAHAYCLTGEEGIGKTAVARALAEELLLGEGQPPRLEVHPDFWCDDRAEAISIDEIRFHPERGAPAHDQSLQQFLSLKPFVAPLRVALLANAERMTEAAQNCLLKTLEEPPPNTVLVLTTAYPDHLLPTCLSRCQLIALSPVGRPALAEFIKARHDNEAEAEALFVLLIQFCQRSLKHRIVFRRMAIVALFFEGQRGQLGRVGANSWVGVDDLHPLTIWK